MCLVALETSSLNTPGVITPRTFSSTRQQLIRLLRYSTFGWDKLPISQANFLIHETTTYPTTSVLDLRMGQAPYFPSGFSRPWDDDLFDYFGTRPSEGQVPHLPRGFSPSMRRRLTRLLRYSTFGGTSFLSPKRISSPMRLQLIDYTRPSEGQILYLPRGFLRPWDDNWLTTLVLDLWRDKFPYLQGLNHPWGDNSSTTTHSASRKHKTFNS